MKLYKNSDGVWAGTQLDARKMCGKGYSTVDVPVDKPGLLKFLNLNKVGSLTDNDKQQEVSDDGDLNQKAMAWFRWSYDCMCRGEYDDAKEHLAKALEFTKKDN